MTQTSKVTTKNMSGKPMGSPEDFLTQPGVKAPGHREHTRGSPSVGREGRSGQKKTVRIKIFTKEVRKLEGFPYGRTGSHRDYRLRWFCKQTRGV